MKDGRSMTRRLALNILALAIGLVAAALLGELILRVYNPVRVPLRGQTIVLPTNKHFVFELPPHAGMDTTVHVTESSLGFRGREPPADFANALTIVTVGGSTTECRYLTDTKTWPAVLEDRLRARHPNVWIANAGLDGHSTFGHIQLLEQNLLALKPKIIVFLIGVNDFGRADLNDFDVMLDRRKKSAGDVLVEHSELLSTAAVLIRSARAVNLGVEHYFALDLKKLRTAEIPNLGEVAEEHRTKYAPGFEKRVRRLIELCKQAGITPILMTQPAMYGEGVDPTTGVELGPLVFAEPNETSAARWTALEVYNDVTRRVAAETGVQVIDLGRLLPKDSAYFYDWMHFTNEGAARVGELVSAAIAP